MEYRTTQSALKIQSMSLVASFSWQQYRWLRARDILLDTYLFLPRNTSLGMLLHFFFSPPFDGIICGIFLQNCSNALIMISYLRLIGARSAFLWRSPREGRLILKAYDCGAFVERLCKIVI